MDKEAVKTLLEIGFSVARKLNVQEKIDAIEKNGTYTNGTDALHEKKFGHIKEIARTIA